MTIRSITHNVFSVGSIDWDRRLFDELIPLPDGTSYNAYYIKGSEKTALLDTVDPTKTHELIANLNACNVTNLDYVICHHAEQDHSGSIPAILSLYPQAKVVTNPKCKAMLVSLLGVRDDQCIEVADGETLSLGDATLEFIYTPFVHWPETMVTYLHEQNILFSCDFFGSHYASSSLFVENEPAVHRAARRYFAEIMMPFRTIIKQHLAKLSSKNITCIAPSHGPVYNNPPFILDLYRDWTSDRVANKVLIPYISMHGSTQAMVDYFVSALMARNIPVVPYNLTKTDLGELACDLVDAATVVLGTPTVIGGAHPGVVSATYLVNLLRPKTKWLFRNYCG